MKYKIELLKQSARDVHLQFSCCKISELSNKSAKKEKRQKNRLHFIWNNCCATISSKYLCVFTPKWKHSCEFYLRCFTLDFNHSLSFYFFLRRIYLFICLFCFHSAKNRKMLAIEKMLWYRKSVCFLASRQHR